MTCGGSGRAMTEYVLTHRRQTTPVSSKSGHVLVCQRLRCPLGVSV